jgi:hypothetical protein
MYTETFSQFKKQLGQLDKWLGMATDYAKSKNFDPDVFATLRLAPDQFPLTRQVQIACDTVKLSAGFLTGKPMPAHEDNEKTLAELQARVRSTISILDGLTPKDARRQPAAVERRMDDGRRLLHRAHDPERELPPHHRVRHPASQRRCRRQA